MSTTMADPTPAEVERYIAQGLNCEHLQVEGDGRHFFATIVSAEFDGASRVARHQRVYRALGDRMREQIHALSMKTLTPAEWAASAPSATPTTTESGRRVHCGRLACTFGGLAGRVSPGLKPPWTNSSSAVAAP